MNQATYEVLGDPLNFEFRDVFTYEVPDGLDTVTNEELHDRAREDARAEFRNRSGDAPSPSGSELPSPMQQTEWDPAGSND